jgi:hypothetical protein
VMPRPLRDVIEGTPNLAERPQQEIAELKPFRDPTDLYDRALGAVEGWVR